MRRHPREPGAAVLVAIAGADLRRRVIRSLQDAGHRCLPADDGLEAYGLLQRHPADVALLDLDLPRMDGLELLGALAAMELTLAVMALVKPRAVEPARRWNVSAVGACTASEGAPVPPVALFLLGAAVGASGTVIGAGGGFLLVPLLLLLYPADPVTSLAALSLAVVALNALSGSLVYARRDRVDVPLGLRLAAASVPGTAAGAILTRFVPRGIFEVAFGVVLLLLAVLLLGRPERGAAGVGTPRPGPLPTGGAPRRPGPGMALSGLVGLLSGLTGIGGSPLQVVVLTHPMAVPVRTAMPTAQFAVLLSALGGVGAHLAQGHFDPGPTRLGALGAGVLLGAPVGAALSERLSSWPWPSRASASASS